MLLFTATFIWNGCKYDLGNASWESDYLAPLAQGTLRLRNIVPDTLLKTDPDGGLRLIYERNLIGLPLDSLFKIPDTPAVYSLNIPFSYTVQPGFPIPFSISPFRFNLKDARVTYARMKSGFIRSVMWNTLPTKVRVNFTIPKAKKNGVPFTLTVFIEAAPAGDTSFYEATFDLSGYEFDLKGTNNNESNVLYIQFSATTDPDGPTVQLPANKTFVFISNTFSELKPEYAKGFMGQLSIVNGPKETPLEPLNKLTSGSLLLDSVKVNLELRNGMGADMRFSIYQLSGRNPYTNSVLPLDHALFNAPINITRALDMGTGSAASVLNYEMNAQNSNLKTFVENLPGFFTYHLKAEINPLGNVSGGNDFIYYNSDLAANLRVEMPLNLSADNISLTDTLSFSGTADFLNRFKKGNLRIYAQNGFPLSGKIEAYLMDSLYQLLSNLVGQNTLQAAVTDANLKVLQATTSEITLPVSEKQAQHLKQARYLIIKVNFSTVSPGSLVRFYDSYTLRLNVVADVSYTW